MDSLEPHYLWRNLYDAADDPRSPFYEREYSELYYTQTIYDHYIHPQWDEFGSRTLYLKILYANYQRGFAIIEMLGEWNDTLYNDIMYLKRNVAEALMEEGIDKFVLIGENVLNYHSSDDCYYQEWFDEANETDGWIALLNFRGHVISEFEACGVDQCFLMGGRLNVVAWRTLSPEILFDRLEALVMKRLGG